MLLGVSARGGCATNRSTDAKMMASTGTTCLWKELLLPQWAPAWRLCSQPRRHRPSGRRRQQCSAALEASHALLCIRAAPAGKPGVQSRVEHCCCNSFACHSFSLSCTYIGGNAYGAALGHLYTSHLHYASSCRPLRQSASHSSGCGCASADSGAGSARDRRCVSAVQAAAERERHSRRSS